MKYQLINGLYCGFADLYISDIVENMPEFFDKFSMIITVLDSSPVKWSKKWINHFNRSKCKVYLTDQYAYVPEDYVISLFNEGITFSHFDEVYLVNDIQEELFEINACFSTSGWRFNEEVPNEFLKIFNGLHASRYLTDGCGLNYACESLSLVKNVLEIENNMQSDHKEAE